MSIFKGNDIRGVYPTELNEDIAKKIGKAFVAFLKTGEVIVAHDNRLSSPQLKKSLIRGILEQGANVMDIGMIDSPGAYFASHYFKKPVVIVTASHNPPEHNGFYLCNKNGESIYKENGLKEIEKLFNKDSISKSPGKKKGKITIRDIKPHYLNHILSFIKEKIKPIKIVIDTGNGVGSITSRLLYFSKKLPQITAIPLYFELDGGFPNRGSDTTVKENLSALREKVVREKADFGIAFDGDADRAAFVDEKGEIIGGSLIGALLAEYFLKNSKKNEKIIYTIGCSRIVSETIEKNNNHGISLREKVGHSFVNARMIKEKALLGIEHTGHYFYRDNFCTESPFITSLIVFQIYSQSNKPISKIISPYRKYYMTEEISFRVKSQEEAIKKLKTILKSDYRAKIDTFDGLFVNEKDFWFRIRPSQTEPLIRLTMEGKSRGLVDREKQRLINIIKSII